MSDRTHVVSHVHASATNLDGLKSGSASVTNVMEQNCGDNTSKSPEPKRNDDLFIKRCIDRIEESSNKLMDSLKASDDMKMSLFMIMQQTMQNL